MRFSIRWLLGATAYVALMLAAIISDSALLADAAWVATFFAFTYAVVVSFASKGKRRALAIGFIVVATGNFAVLYVAPYRLPARYLLPLFGYALTPDGTLVVESARRSGTAGGQLTTFRGATKNKQAFRAANAIGTMLAGLVGSGIGALAYKDGN